jgi:hypothetical protein
MVPAAADAGIKGLAKAECRHERNTETREFENRYGGTGKGAINRCARHEKREATRDCKQDRRYETNEFAVEYGGTDRAALKRCIRDELR